MNMHKQLMAALLAVLVPCTARAAQPTIVVSPAQPLRQLSVSATATKSAAPDMATIGFTILTHDERSAVTATSDNNQIYEGFAAQEQAIGIPAQDIHTRYFNVTYTPPQPRGGIVAEYGYTVTRSAYVDIHRLDLVGKVIDTAVATGVNNVNSVSFGLSDNHPLLLRALADAVAQARSAAESIARAAGVQIVRVHTISQGYMTLPTGTADVYAVRTIAGVVSTAIQPTNVSVQATVSIVYDIR